MCERKQTVCIGTDERGELLWKMIDMERWQMEMFPVKVDEMAEFFSRWFDLKMYQEEAIEYEERPVFNAWQRALAESQRHLNYLRLKFPRKRGPSL